MSRDVDYATELSGEVMATVWDSFMALFHTIWYRRSYMVNSSTFKEVQLLKQRIKVSSHPEICQYVEMCSKKLAVLLCSNALEGFHMDLISSAGIEQRFVFTVTGKLNFAGFSRTRGDELLRSIEADGVETVKAFTQYEKKMQKLSSLKSFKIVFGLREATMNMYQRFPRGPFQMDTDSELFPWGKPRTKPKDLDKPLLDFKSSVDSPGHTPPRASAKENSPSPEHLDDDSDDEILSGSDGEDLFADPKPKKPAVDLHVKNSCNTPSKTDKLFLPLASNGSGKPSKQPALINIHDMKLGESIIRLNLYALSYISESRRKKLSKPAAIINSPGDYFRTSEYFDKKDSPTTGLRTPPTSGERFQSNAGGTPGSGSPVSSTPPSCRRIRTAQSSRSLAAEFEEAVKNDTQSRGVPINPRGGTAAIAISPLARPRTILLPVPALRSFRTGSVRRRT